MARSKSRPRTIDVGNGYAAAQMDPEDFQAANQERSPSEQLSQTPRCGSRLATPRDGEEVSYCLQPAGAGTDHVGFGHCKFHGGNTPSGKKAGKKKEVEAIVRRHREERLRFGGSRHDPDIADLGPHEVLLEEVRRSVAMVRWIEERIANWNIVDLATLRDLPTDAKDRELAGLPALQTETFKGTPMATDAHSWLIVYRDERAHMIRVSKLAIDSGVQERLVRIAEQQGEMLTVAIRAILAALSLSPEQQELVPQVVPQILRQIATDPANLTIPGQVA